MSIETRGRRQDASAVVGFYAVPTGVSTPKSLLEKTLGAVLLQNF